ncbi:MAG: Ni/Fe-hydrogenase, b-type cytochrome subunit [Nitrospiraceae bacterium]|nr:Ni/Fe-hydrogenase, b-type cytochrome subunit [Nitrospiraceae bacterium]
MAGAAEVRRRIYVWEFPVRLSHWVNVLAITVLSVTGLYIGTPFLYPVSDTAFTMGWMRFLHLTAGYLFLMMVALRVYWSFAGNKYSNWRVFVPRSKSQVRDLKEVTNYYLFKRSTPPYDEGHTACAAFAYFLLFLIFLFQIFSGFALFNNNSHTAVHFILGGWLARLINIKTIRFWHHMLMYPIWAFVIVHIYLSLLMDSSGKNGLLGSIFGGYKFMAGRG